MNSFKLFFLLHLHFSDDWLDYIWATFLWSLTSLGFDLGLVQHHKRWSTLIQRIPFRSSSQVNVETAQHGLSQQGVWVPFWTPKPLKRSPQDTQIFLCGISKNLNLKLIIKYFHLLIIPMILFNDIMPYFDEFIHVYGWNMSILWSP